MYINISGEIGIRDTDIIGIFDLDTSTVQKKTRVFLNTAEKNGEVINTSYDIPKTFVVCEKKGKTKIYLSSQSAYNFNKKRTRRK